MINCDNEILSGLDLLIKSWTFEDPDDLSAFAKGMITGLEVAKNYIISNMKGIEDD